MQYIGIILLILALAAGLYVANNPSVLLKLKWDIPLMLHPISVPVFDSGLSDKGGNESGAEPIGGSTAIIETRKTVTIDSIRQSDNYNNYIEVMLSADLGDNEKVDITGWTIKSNKGYYTIPKAQQIYSFGGNQDEIYLKRGDGIHIYSGLGPKGNFRLNECMGYIENLSPFIPSIESRCPSVNRSEIRDLSGQCQDYILSLNECENPSANPAVPLDDSNCHQFLSKLNYVGCVEKYQSNQDFLLGEWWIWAGNQINIFDPTHDKVQLIDKNGKVVDEYTY